MTDIAWLTVRQFAASRGCHVQTVYSAIRRGLLKYPIERVGRTNSHWCFTWKHTGAHGIVMTKSLHPLVLEAEEALRLSVSEQLDAMRLQQDLSVERMARAADMSKTSALKVLKTTADYRLSLLVRLAQSMGKRIRITFEPLNSSPRK